MSNLNSDIQYLRNLADSGFGNEDQCERYLEIAEHLEALLDDADALLLLVPVLERVANYPFGGHTPPEMRKLASEALAALPEHLMHECVWIDPTNEYVMGGGICLGCGAIRAELPEHLRKE